MGKHHRTSDDAQPQAATGDPGATYWSVADAGWPAVRPALPAEMVDLLAPPIVVGVARVAATSRLIPPPGAPGRPVAPATSFQLVDGVRGPLRGVTGRR
ncbi:hypothetical protein [Micromonospora rubida]|uniref:hypothetical protein n=1 Tax=Micromonospora rubida TaxID=2697657 RepID=UPI001F43DFAF|nr:hypothetical protein [Micromonospora rubida]